MNDIAAFLKFLKARLDEEEQVARAATAGPWLYNPGKMWLEGEAFESFDRSKGEEYVAHGGPSPFTGCIAATGPAGHSQSMADAAFIARHDPARALAEVEAKRQRIKTYELAVARQRAEWGDYSAWLDGGHGDPSMALNGPDPKLIPGLELALRQDALPFAEHEGYQEGWRP